MTEQEKIQQADSVHLTGDDGQVPSAASRGEAAGDRTAAPTQPEPPLGNFMGFMYLARRPCGRVSAMRWDDQGHERNTAASVAEWIADGLTVDRVKRHEGDPLPEWICDGCRGNPCKEQPSQSQGHGAPTGQSRTFEAGEATCASNEPDEQDTSSVSRGMAQDAARLDWLTRNISGAELRRIGVVWAAWSPEQSRAAIDAALRNTQGERK